MLDSWAVPVERNPGGASLLLRHLGLRARRHDQWELRNGPVRSERDRLGLERQFAGGEHERRHASEPRGGVQRGRRFAREHPVPNFSNFDGTMVPAGIRFADLRINIESVATERSNQWRVCVVESIDYAAETGHHLGAGNLPV